MIVIPMFTPESLERRPALRLEFETQEELQSFRNMLRENLQGDTSCAACVGRDSFFRQLDPLATEGVCLDVVDAIGQHLYGASGAFGRALAALPTADLMLAVMSLGEEGS